MSSARAAGLNTDRPESARTAFPAFNKLTGEAQTVAGFAQLRR